MTAMPPGRRYQYPQTVWPTLSDEAKDVLEAHHWPGNVRELDNVVQRALILKTGDEVFAADLCFENEDTGSVETAPVVETKPAAAPGRLQASASEPVSSANQ